MSCVESLNINCKALLCLLLKLPIHCVENQTLTILADKATRVSLFIRTTKSSFQRATTAELLSTCFQVVFKSNICMYCLHQGVLICGGDNAQSYSIAIEYEPWSQPSFVPQCVPQPLAVQIDSCRYVLPPNRLQPSLPTYLYERRSFLLSRPSKRLTASNALSFNYLNVSHGSQPPRISLRFGPWYAAASSYMSHQLSM